MFSRSLCHRPRRAASRLLACSLGLASCGVHAQQAVAPAALDEIVVTATTGARALSDAPASVSVVDGAELRQRPVHDLADALDGLPGLRIDDSVGLGRRGISIRGMDPSHTLVLVDGQRISTSSAAIAHSDFELGWTPAVAIERVEAVRGPMSSLYGSEALGGVVNAITRSATDAWHGEWSSTALTTGRSGSGSRFRSGLYVGGPLVPGTLGLNAWGEFKRRNALRAAGNTALTALDENHASMGHVGLTWTPDSRQRIDLSVDAGKEELDGERAGTAGAVYRTENRADRRRYALSHTGEWAWGSSRVRIYRSALDRRASRSDGGTETGPNHFVDTVLDGQVSLAVGTTQRLTLGAEARRERLEDPTVNLAGKKAQNHYALFAQDEIRLGQQWELVLGSRFDQHEDFGRETSPRAYLLYRPSEAWTIKVGVGRGFKAPTLKQLSSEYESRAAIGGRGIIRGNPALRPETNQSFELGAALDRGSWQASATLFNNDVKNLVETVRQPTCFEAGKICLEYENISRARLRGLELTASTLLPGRLRLDANYTWLDATNRSTGLRLAERARHSANASLEWAALDALSTRLRVEYTGSQYRSATESDRPAYTLLHWYLDYALNPRVSLQGGIENLTDKRLANDDVSVYSRADEGRRYFVGLNVSF
ncbi:TonB-dependent receptor [Corticibacter populi]|uniref:TonB-dependent receptor n=1 Tax=Corticibacter populi TaxID=1550736 RepID=A0A3M6QIQ2_9BURK|nr:TonB-dependent receptor [Corticibacter populi]RMX02970.1 TonB-dependent receptor [Corticibacter populi]RZS33394.1 outer membrane receptor for ferrienterochelin and colicins [Corticibacter populi]